MEMMIRFTDIVLIMGGHDYYLGRWSHDPYKFDNLRDITKVRRFSRDGHNYYYELRFIEPDKWRNQWFKTTRGNFEGIFWARLGHDAENNYYISIWRGLADPVADTINTRGGPVWGPNMKIPVYFSD